MRHQAKFAAINLPAAAENNGKNSKGAYL